MNSASSNRAQAWKTDHWFVSPWNYEAEVTAGFRPPKQVRIHDITEEEFLKNTNRVD